MIGKITSPPRCKTAIDYITAVNKEGKKSTLLCHSDGILPTDNKVMAACLEAATLKGDHNLKKYIKHISLDFSEQDKERMTDELMEQIAKEYMEQMGYKDTEYVMYRHHDKPFPHCHIVASRVNRMGEVISDSQERVHNVEVCKQLTMKYNLYMAKGKERVNIDALRDPDKERMLTMQKVMAAMERAADWKEFEAQLKLQGIAMKFHYNNVTRKLMGISFDNGQHSYSGKKLDNSLVYARLAEKFGDIRQLAELNAQSYYENTREYRLARTDSFHDWNVLNDALPEFDTLSQRGFPEPPDINSLLSNEPTDMSRFIDFSPDDILTSKNLKTCFLPLNIMVAVALAPFSEPMVQCSGGGGGGGSSDDRRKEDDDERWKFRFNYQAHRSAPKVQSKPKPKLRR